ncbi:MAG TPA: hypothetical protein DF383_09855 [Deltaproteobacteria bacterium]|nr:hypothetical protein [Deltaproteobacteria bacterium]
MNIPARAEKAFQLLTQLNEIDVEKYQEILKNRLGGEVLAVFESYCREIMPEENNEEVLGTLVHLMITGFLVSSNETNEVFGPNIEIAE